MPQNPSTRPELSARIDVTWFQVLLRADQVRTDTLRALAEAWAEDPDLVTDVLNKLAEAATVGPVGSWEAAVEDAEADLQMDMPEVSIGEQDAERLADELRAAAPMTSTARSRTGMTVWLPKQQAEAA